MEQWQIYAAAIATVMAVVGLVLGMAKECKNQIATVYKRFDQYKQHMEGTHVSKEVCGILHNQIIEDLVELKADVKKLLIMAKNGKQNGNN